MLLNLPGADLIDPKVLQIMYALNRLDTAMSGRQVARVLDAGKSAVAETLGRMVAVGILDVESVGRSLQYRPNRSHFYWALFTHLASFQQELQDRVRQLIDLPGKPLDKTGNSLFLFGSVARGESGADSDLDVGIITASQAVYQRIEAADRDLRIVHELEAYTGNRVQLFMVDRDTFDTMVHGEDPLIDSWGRDAVSLWGRHPRDLAEETLGLSATP